jgi:hypothetical protein
MTLFLGDSIGYTPLLHFTRRDITYHNDFQAIAGLQDDGTSLAFYYKTQLIYLNDGYDRAYAPFPVRVYGEKVLDSRQTPVFGYNSALPPMELPTPKAVKAAADDNAVKALFNDPILVQPLTYFGHAVVIDPTASRVLGNGRYTVMIPMTMAYSTNNALDWTNLGLTLLTNLLTITGLNFLIGMLGPLMFYGPQARQRRVFNLVKNPMQETEGIQSLRASNVGYETGFGKNRMVQLRDAFSDHVSSGIGLQNSDSFAAPPSGADAGNTIHYIPEVIDTSFVAKPPFKPEGPSRVDRSRGKFGSDRRPSSRSSTPDRPKYPFDEYKARKAAGTLFKPEVPVDTTASSEEDKAPDTVAPARRGKPRKGKGKDATTDADELIS